jgi:tetratricopeptide (TPR) repeat protein
MPATIRNLAVSGDLVLISSNAGVNLYIGNNEAANGRFRKDIPDLEGFGTSFDYAAVVRRLEERAGRPMKYSEVSRYFTAKAWDFIEEHPLRFLELLLKKTALFFGPEEISHNNVLKWDRGFSRVLAWLPGDFSLLLSLAVVGCLLLVMDLRSRSAGESDRTPVGHEAASGTALILLLVSVYSASFLPFFVTALYRVPVTPFFLLFGAYGSFRIGTLIGRRKVLSSLAWIALAAALYGAMHLFLYESEPGKEARGLATWHFNQAVSLQHGGRIEEAVLEYREAVEAFPDYHEAHVQLAVLLGKQGRTGEAGNHFQEALRIRPDSAGAHLGYASLLANQGKIEEAVPHYRKAAALRPEDAEARFLLANALAMKGSLEDAEREYALVLSMRPEHAEARCNLGVVLARQERVDEAIAMYRSALRIRPSYAAALANLGMALESQGQIRDAIQCYRQALEIDPKDDPTRRRLADLLAKEQENARER